VLVPVVPPAVVAPPTDVVVLVPVVPPAPPSAVAALVAPPVEEVMGLYEYPPVAATPPVAQTPPVASLLPPPSLPEHPTLDNRAAVVIAIPPKDNEMRFMTELPVVVVFGAEYKRPVRRATGIFPAIRYGAASPAGPSR
jgi:hypothetical protein